MPLSSKEMWFQEFEREMNELEDCGLPTESAYRIASERAFGKAQEALAEKIDTLRQQKKDEG